MKPRIGMVVLAIAASFVACQQSSERQAGKMAKATAVAEQKKAVALQEREQGDPRAVQAMAESQEASERAARESADFLNAVAREQNRYHALLTKEIAWLDRRLVDLEKNAGTTHGALRAEKDAEITAGRQWEARLRDDLDLVDHLPPETDWSALKQKVDRDLDENRPAATPRWYEKAYGI